MIAVAYFFGAVSGLIGGFVICAMLMFREKTAPSDPQAAPHGDVPHMRAR